MLNQIPAKNLVTEKEIGKGGYGIVYTGKWHKTPVAIKKLLLTNPSAAALAEFKKEAEIMAQCRHPNVVLFYGACLESGEYALVMDYVAKGSLYHVLHNPQEKLPWYQRWGMAEEIGLGLNYLHEQKIIHRDLNSRNILIDENNHPKITDFGLSKVKLETSTSTTKGATGSIRWQAPELFQPNGHSTQASDIYSYGMVLWEIASRKDPFEKAPNEIMAMSWILQGTQEKIPEDAPKEYGAIIQQCWQTAEKRPSAYEVTLLFEQHKPQSDNINQPEKEKSWHYDRSYFNQTGIQDASEEDTQKVITFYQHHPVPKYEIKSVKVLINPDLNRQFALRLKLLQARKTNTAFNPKWPDEKNTQREKINQLSEDLSQPYQDSDYPDVKILPLWHGTSPTALEGILKTGYANLATTDNGFFGKGIYSAWEAEYAHRVYDKGSLLLNWVCYYSAYPTIFSDMSELIGKGNYGNYDAHFVPVYPASSNPNESAYYPCKPNQNHQYIEVVVFESSQCLPRYLVELQPTLTIAPKIDIPTLSKPATTETKPTEILFKLEPPKPKIPELIIPKTTQPPSPNPSISNPTIPQIGMPEFLPKTIETKPDITPQTPKAEPKPISFTPQNPTPEETAFFLEETIKLLKAHAWSTAQKKYFEQLLSALTFNDFEVATRLKKEINEIKPSIFDKIQKIFATKTQTNYTFFKQNAGLHAKHYRKKQTLTDHANGVNTLQTLSATTFASGSYDKTIKIWQLNPNTQTYTCTQTLTGHTWSVSTLRTLSATTFASGSGDKTIRIWQLNPKTQTYTCTQTLTGHTSYIHTLQSLSATTFASGSDDNTIKIWQLNPETSTYTCTQTLTDHTSYVSTLQPLTATTFASGSWKEIKIWQLNPETSTYTCTQTLTDHTNSVNTLQPLTATTFASGSKDKTIKIWHLNPKTQTYTCTQTLKEHTNDVYTLQTLTTTTFASGSEDETIKIWHLNPNTQTYTCTQTLTNHTSWVNTLQTLNATTFASGSRDNTIKIWQPNLKPTLKELEEKAPECKMM